MEHFLTIFFREANRASIHYLVLRNFDFLPDDWGKDLDLLVEPKDVPAGS